MPLIILAGGPRDGEVFQSRDLQVDGYSSQTLLGPTDLARDEDADLVVMVHDSVREVDERMKVGHSAWEAARDAGKLFNV